MNFILNPILRAFAPMLLLRAELASQNLPRPRDEPTTRVKGTDPDQLILIGGGIAVGFGVLSHDLSLAGHLARQVSVVTGRGIRVDVVAHPDLTMNGIPAAIADINLAGYDAVVMALGVTDAIRRTPIRVWRTQLHAFLANISERTAANVHIFVVAAQPMRTVTTFDNLIGHFAEGHGRTLNRESRKVCDAFPGATFVPFEPGAVDPERYRSSRVYGQWARLISPTVSDVLRSTHPLDDFTI